MAVRANGLVARAVAHPDDLSPYQLEDEARHLTALALSKRTGMAVDPAEVALNPTRRLTAEQFAQLEMEAHELRAAYLAQLPDDQALLVVAALLPQLRPTLHRVASANVQAALADERLIDINFKLISDFLTLFELRTRLAYSGLALASGQSLFERFAEFDEGRAFIISVWLFPALLPIILRGASASDRALFLDPELRNRTIGFVFQQFNLRPRTTALRQVMLPCLYARPRIADPR